jgi:hypothetical protein
LLHTTEKKKIIILHLQFPILYRHKQQHTIMALQSRYNLDHPWKNELFSHQSHLIAHKNVVAFCNRNQIFSSSVITYTE